MEVHFTGLPTPQIQWFREDSEIHSTRDFQISTSQHKSTLCIPEVFAEDAGLFTVRASNPSGVVECKGILTVDGIEMSKFE